MMWRLLKSILELHYIIVVYEVFYPQGCGYRRGVIQMQCEIIIKREEAGGRGRTTRAGARADAISLPRLRPRRTNALRWENRTKNVHTHHEYLMGQISHNTFW